MYRFILFFVLFLFSCEVPELNEEHKQGQTRERVTNKIMKRVAIKIKEETGLILCGFGGGSVDCVEMLALCFNCREPLTLEEARELLVFSERKFIDAVNEDEQIRPFLCNYPFGSKNIEIQIFVQDPKGGHFPSSFADIICCINGICSYEKMNEVPKRIQSSYKETFEEAELKVKTSCAK